MRLLNRIKKGPESAEDAYSPKLVIAYEPSEALKEEFKALGDQVEVKAIGRDALVFMANQSNPVSSLTAEQIVEIYTGRVQNWKEIGGEDREILAFQRPENSGSQNLMEKLVMKDIPMEEAPKEFIVQEMGELLEEVSAYDNEGNALGYSVYFYASNMYERPELKFMAVDDVMPDRDTIRNGNYPFVNDFYAAIPAYLAADDPARILYEWLTSEDGQGLINGLGYVGAADVKMETGLEAEEAFSGELDLPEGKVLLASGRYLFGESGIAVFDGKLRLLDFIRYASLDGLDTFKEADLEEELALLVRLWSGVCDINKSHMPGCVATKSVSAQSAFWSVRCGVSDMAAKARASCARLVVCRNSGHKPQLLSPIVVAEATGAILCAGSHAQPLLVAAAAGVVS